MMTLQFGHLHLLAVVGLCKRTFQLLNALPLLLQQISKLVVRLIFNLRRQRLDDLSVPVSCRGQVVVVVVAAAILSASRLPVSSERGGGWAVSRIAVLPGRLGPD
uniref:Secreted protein n=1 Tax=Ixodes ricinus TaxID=34613 RepID=A0A6B0UG41_IXORI